MCSPRVICHWLAAAGVYILVIWRWAVFQLARLRLDELQQASQGLKNVGSPADRVLYPPAPQRFPAGLAQARLPPDSYHKGVRVCVRAKRLSVIQSTPPVS